MSRLTIIVACAIVLLSAAIAQGAAVPQKINYQAVLLDDVGDPVTDPVDLTFRIYSDTLGAPVWSQTINGVQPDANGQFSVVLGEDMNWIDHDILTGDQLWLSVEVGTEGEMHPFTELVSSAYSFRVNTVDQAEAGTIYGPLTIEESLTKAADAQVIVTCAAKAPETVEISPCDGIILRATNQTDDEVLLAEVDDVDQDALLTMTDPGTDAQAAYSASAAEFGTNVAKALQKKYIYGGAGFQHLADNQVDILGEWGELAPGQSYVGMTDYSAKAEGHSIRIRPPSADLAEVFTVTRSNGDQAFNLHADPDGAVAIDFFGPSLKLASTEKTRIGNMGFSFFGASNSEELLMVEEEVPGVVSISGTDYSAKAAGASIKIKPPTASQAEVFTVSTSTGDPTFKLESDPSAGPSMRFYSSAKASDVMIINNAGIYFTNLAKSETLMTITSDGHVIGKGQIAMGQGMSNSGNYSNVLGHYNSADGDSSAVLGGYDNSADGHAAVVCGGAHNSASGPWSFVGGGYSNTATGDRATVCAGGLNVASVLLATVGGGWSNLASGQNSTVAGGIGNEATLYAAAVSGGWDNIASGNYTTIGGGAHNRASSNDATVAGGSGNVASNTQATVGGGYADTASGSNATVGGGGYNVASGDRATVPGGWSNLAAGDYSFAAGRRAKIDSTHHGTFVWADHTIADFASTGPKQFLIRAGGGVGINTNSPSVTLHVGTGTDSDTTGGGYVVTGSVTSNNISMDNNEIMARNNGRTAPLNLNISGGDVLMCSYGGDVGIGTTNPSYKLDVNGDINVSGSYNVKKGGVNYNHPDYVFEPDYHLMPLEDLKEYVQQNKSLPNVITADEVKKNDGFKMDELMIEMLEKIEEQTLYIFQLEERIAELEKKQQNQ